LAATVTLGLLGTSDGLFRKNQRDYLRLLGAKTSWQLRSTTLASTA
jgi:hypothetical protein